MRTLTSPLLTLFLAAGTLSACADDATTVEAFSPGVERASVVADAPTDAWVAGINQAGWDFHRTIDGNAISSPISLGAAFSLLRAGATEPTDGVLDSIFGFPAGDGVHTAANAVLTDLEASTTGSTTLDISNRIFTRVDPLQPFVDTAAANYGADLAPLANDSTAAADEVNAWTSEQTRGLVPKIVEPTDITADTILVIVNTVYLDAEWSATFEASLTSPSTFTTASSDAVEVDFMSMLEPTSLRYLERADSIVVELPYKDGDLAMWLIVPTETQGLESVEAALDAATIANFGAEAAPGLVSLRMPKWEFALPPTDLLATWLCPSGLCAGAPLHNINSDRSELQFAVHGAKILVDEQGTEAGAATAIGVMETSAPEVDLYLDVDHPFTYVITHEPTGTIVFAGRVTDPSVTE